MVYRSSRIVHQSSYSLEAKPKSTRHSDCQEIYIESKATTTTHPRSPKSIYLQVILERAETLRGSEPRLEPETESLHISPVQHPRKEASDIGVLLLQNLGEIGWCISADGPLGRSKLPLVAENEVVEQFGRFRVRSVFENGCSLRPGDERCIGWLGSIHNSTLSSAASSKGGDVRGIRKSKLVARCSTSSDPSRVLGDEGVKPFDTERIDTNLL